MYYLGWAPVVKWFRRHLLAIMLSTVALKALLATWAHAAGGILAQELLRMLQFEAMAIGGLAAYLVFHCQRPIHTNVLFSRPLQVALVLPLLVRLLAHRAAAQNSVLYAAVFDHAVLAPLVLMALFAWFIVNVSLNERAIFRFDSPLLNYLGNISYGIYMYHALVISLVFVPFLDDYREAPGWPATLLLHVLVGSVSLLFAALSKRFFEDRFLRYKVRFAVQPAIHTDAEMLAAKRAVAA
jgi:peptidoglycan/LPS O-acetylase OafA/YrhL